MGWGSGTFLFDKIMNLIFGNFNKDLSPEEIQKDIRFIIAEFESMDWDCQEGSEYIQNHPIVKAAYKELHPDE